MGFDDEAIDKCNSIPQFVRNSFMIRTSAMITLTKLMQQAMEIVSTDDSVKAKFEIDSKYTGNTDAARKVFGKDYYELHPLIFVRLPVCFTHLMECRTCMGNDPICDFNIS
eukprot:gene13363-17923_t